ncbi:hypothetical protein [Bradyrhizobium sp. Cp5.3]|uniref:hypothetical protein n=1 Tax=Bradyrhizobium sp. Cp5.3 TaxID=443598 RepID=UPI0012EBB3C1|nr:hypothetical protein [Bradyrhizobium sp. Cp5.3]
MAGVVYAIIAERIRRSRDGSLESSADPLDEITTERMCRDWINTRSKLLRDRNAMIRLASTAVATRDDDASLPTIKSTRSIRYAWPKVGARRKSSIAASEFP